MDLDTELARRNMTHQQIRCWDVLNTKVLDALAGVPREHFVPEQYGNLAFADTPLPIAPGHAMEATLSPTLEGKILEALDIQPNDRALIVGIGNGYLTACLTRLCQDVTGIDASPELVEASRQKLTDIGISTVRLKVQEPFADEMKQQFDVVAITGSLPQYDQTIETWLKPGGRAFVVTGLAPVMAALLIRRAADGEISTESLFETVIAPLPNLNPKPTFDF